MQLPSDLQSESYLLSRMLNSINAVNDAFSDLAEDDFLDPLHRVIFSSMKILYTKDLKIESASVANIMKSEFPKEANTAYLFGLGIDKVGDIDSVKLFIDNIKEKSRLRKMILMANNLIVEASNQEKKSSQLHGEFNRNLETVFSKDYEKSSLTMEQLCAKDYCDSGLDFMEYLELQMENKRKGLNTLKGYQTGYSKIDNMLSGLSKGHYVIIGARPGAGKTTLAINMMLNLMKQNIKVGFFSLEMTADEFQKKLVFLDAGIDQESFHKDLSCNKTFQNLFVSREKIRKMPLVFDDQAALTVTQLISRTNRWVTSDGIQVLFIDYLGEIKGDGKFNSKQEETSHVSKSIRALAKRLKIPIVCICQLNRENEKETRPPRKSDLRDSGQIEADAHTILLMHKHLTNDGKLETGRVGIHIVKNRFGREGIVHMHFNGQVGQFLEIDYTVSEKDEDE